jgi:hypothetical protein
MPWDLIDKTYFPCNVVIVLVQFGLKLHYVLLIGKSDDSLNYIVTDQS